jgi:hypothetical protein
VLHFSVQWDHVHFVAEASDKRALSEGVRSVAIRIARGVNELVGRKGRFWADRWFGRALTTPRQVRNALVYVLANFRKHAKRPMRQGVDAFSSASLFVSGAKTWLAATGWRRLGLIRVDEAPRGAEREALGAARSD